MKVLPCRHRLLPQEEGYCWLESSRWEGDDRPSLVFRSFEGDHPVRCGAALSRACPWRSWEGRRAELVPCPHCRKRHRQGSTSQQLCEAWSSAKAALKELRGALPEGARFFPLGTTQLPYPDHTPDLVRRLVWDRLKAAVLRRDRYRCQDCGEDFGRRRRKAFDPALRRGRGGYRWESLEVHHIIPRADGGSDHPGNLKTLCPDCHRAYTSHQAAERAAARRDRNELLRALEAEGSDSEVYDPRD